MWAKALWHCMSGCRHGILKNWNCATSFLMWRRACTHTRRSLSHHLPPHTHKHTAPAMRSPSQGTPGKWCASRSCACSTAATQPVMLGLGPGQHTILSGRSPSASCDAAPGPPMLLALCWSCIERCNLLPCWLAARPLPCNPAGMDSSCTK